MWTTTVSFPRPMFSTPLTNRTNLKTPKLTASLSDYPLASRIMVRNLRFTTAESSLQKEFANFGEIAEVKLVKDKMTNKSKGYAFIQYMSQEDALLALENMDHKVLDGRLIHVDIAKPGKDIYGGLPVTSGPPKKQWQHFPEIDEVADCWY